MATKSFRILLTKCQTILTEAYGPLNSMVHIFNVIFHAWFLGAYVII